MNIFRKSFLKKLFYKISEKKSAIEYNIKAPKDIDTADMSVPNHLPKRIPEIISSGEPNPKRETQIIEKIKKKH